MQNKTVPIKFISFSNSKIKLLPGRLTCYEYTYTRLRIFIYFNMDVQHSRFSAQILCSKSETDLFNKVLPSGDKVESFLVLSGYQLHIGGF